MKRYYFKFDIGDTVFLKTDSEKLQRVVTGISMRQNGISYELAQSNSTSWHYDFEIESELNKKVIGYCQK